MVQFKINAVSNAKRGKSDLATLLPWLRRYKDWLTDRVRINKYKGAFLWDIQLTGADAKTIDRKRMQYAYPPEPGSIIVHNESEQWSAVQPQIEAGDAAADGRAIKMMIAMGAGLPEHYLAEGGEVNRATAAEMGLPTFRKFQRRQDTFGLVIRAIVDRVLEEAVRAGALPAGIDRAYRVVFPELAPGDNRELAAAGGTHAAGAAGGAHCRLGQPGDGDAAVLRGDGAGDQRGGGVGAGARGGGGGLRRGRGAYDRGERGPDHTWREGTYDCGRMAGSTPAAAGCRWLRHRSSRTGQLRRCPLRVQSSGSGRGDRGCGTYDCPTTPAAARPSPSGYPVLCCALRSGLAPAAHENAGPAPRPQSQVPSPRSRHANCSGTLHPPRMKTPRSLAWDCSPRGLPCDRSRRSAAHRSRPFLARISSVCLGGGPGMAFRDDLLGQVLAADRQAGAAALPAGAGLHGLAHRARHAGLDPYGSGAGLAGGTGLHPPHHAALAGSQGSGGGGSGSSAAGQAAQGQAGVAHRSRLTLPARAGLQKLETGIVQSYDPTSGARVRLLGAQAGLIGPLPVSQSIAPALLVVGARCLVAMLDETNPADGAVFGVFGGSPAPWVQAGSASLLLIGAQQSTSVGFPLPFAAVLGVAATSRDAAFVASVSGEYAGGFLLTLTRREGVLQLQAGVATVTVASGATSGSVGMTFPAAFAVGRTVVAASTNPGWVASVGIPSPSGCSLTLSALGSAHGPISVAVYWQATGDPAVNQTVPVDWLAVGS